MAMLLGAVGGAAGGLGSLGTILGVVQMGLEFVGGMQQASQAKKIANFNAAQMEENARQERMMGSVQASRERRRNRAVLASQTASFADAGALSGTAYGALDQSAVNQEMDALTLEYQGYLRGLNLENQAQVTRYEGQQRANSIRAGAIGGALGGIMSFDPLNVGGSASTPSSSAGFLSRSPFARV